MGWIIGVFKKFDVWLVLCILLLQSLALSVLYSTSLANPNMSIFYKQLLFAVCGWVFFIFFAFYNYHSLAKVNRLIYPGILFLLVYVLFFSRDIRGSSRWIDLGFFQLQPAEFTKFFLTIVLARWFSLKQALVNSWKYITVTILLTALPAVLILLEPDLGSAIAVSTIWIGMILVSPISKKLLATLVLIFVISVGLSWEFLLMDYQKHRLEVFLDPNLDPKGKGYNVRQATIAVGSGQFLGRGLGKGLQSQLKFLPERQTDFVFAAAAEETGLIGVSVILGLYGYILYRLVLGMQQAKDYLGKYLLAGFFSVIVLQIVVNIGMNIGIMPVTGIPLPFFSYGGSSLIVSYMMMGVVQSVLMQAKTMKS